MPADKPKTRSESRKRQALVQVRLSKEEKAEMQRRTEIGGFQSVADMIRVRCLGRRPLKPRLDMQLLVDVQAAIDRVGVNVNQIARKVNQTGAITPEQVQAIHDALEALYEHLDGLYPQR